MSRAGAGLCNAFMRLRGKEFRAVAHPPQAMVNLVRRHGFEPFARRRALFWRGVAFERMPRPSALDPVSEIRDNRHRH
jgi:hypothetical protein